MNDHTDLKAAIHEALDERDAIDRATHHDHHRWIMWKMEREAKRAEWWARVRGTVVGGAILMLLSGAATLLTWVANLVLKSHGGGHGG